MKNFGIKKYLLLYAFLCLQVPILTAQKIQNITRKISLQVCINKAISNNLQVKQAKLQVETSENNLLISKFNQYPNLNGSFSQYFTAGRNIDPFTNQYTDQHVNYQNIGLSSSTLLYGGNQLRNAIQLNELGVLAAEKDEKVIEELLTLNVIGAFFQVLNTEDQLDIAKRQLESSVFQQKRTENMLREGVSTRSALLDLLAQIAGDELSVANAEIAIEIAKTNLLQIMNEKSFDNLELDRTGMIPTRIEAYKEPLTRIVDVAKGTQAVMSAAKLRAEMAEKNREIVSASKLPTVSLVLGLGTNYSSAAPTQQFISDGKPSKLVESKTKDYVMIAGQKQNIVGVSEIASGSYKSFGYFNQLDFNFNKLLGISVKIPIFNGYSSKYKIENAQIGKLVADYQLKNTQVQLQNAIELAHKNMTAAFKRFTLIDKQLTAFENAFELTKTRFEEGIINSLEYTLAKSNLDKIRLNQVQAKYDYIFRTKVLDFYQGKL